MCIHISLKCLLLINGFGFTNGNYSKLILLSSRRCPRNIYAKKKIVQQCLNNLPSFEGSDFYDFYKRMQFKLKCNQNLYWCVASVMAMVSFFEVWAAVWWKSHCLATANIIAGGGHRKRTNRWKWNEKWVASFTYTLASFCVCIIALITVKKSTTTKQGNLAQWNIHNFSGCRTINDKYLNLKSMCMKHIWNR